MVRMSAPVSPSGPIPEGICPICGADSTKTDDVRALTHAVQALTAELRMQGNQVAVAVRLESASTRRFSYRVRRAAAQLRLRIDKRGGITTPDWIRRLAEGSDDRAS